MLELYNKVLGAEHPHTLDSMSHVAGAIDRQGQYIEAEAMHRQVLELRTKVLGAEHPHTLVSMNNLAAVHRVHEDQAFYPSAGLQLKTL